MHRCVVSGDIIEHIVSASEELKVVGKLSCHASVSGLRPPLYSWFFFLNMKQITVAAASVA